MYDNMSTEELLLRKKELERDVRKYDVLQNSMKVCLNSAYGTLGCGYFRFFDTRLAEAVTVTGQVTIRWIQNGLNAFLDLEFGSTKDRIVAGDTDSMYISLEDLPIIQNMSRLQQLDEYCENVITPEIDRLFSEIFDYFGAYLPRMEMKRESIADRAIWTAKKRYVLNTLDKEGVCYNPPKISATGMSVVSSSTPKIARTQLKEALRILLQENEHSLHRLIKDTKEKFSTASPIEIAFNKSVSGLDTYTEGGGKYKKGTPLQTRAALLYNNQLDVLGLTKKYEKIRNKDKIKYVYLVPLNPIGEDVIAFIDDLPKEFGLDSYIDRNKQYDIIFEKPLQTICDVVNWSTAPVHRLF